MSRGRKIAFAVLTLVLVLGVVEGVGRVIWAMLEYRAFRHTATLGAAGLRNDGINFMKEVDGRYGYVLKPGFVQGGVVINDQGFAQRDRVAVARRPGVLRVVALGESTTQGHDVDSANYPALLKRVIKARATGWQDVEVINAGVSGWVSDQIALRSEHELARYRPDVVMLYVGWNDFQSYNPLGPPPSLSYFTQAYGGTHWVAASHLRSVELLRAAVAALRRPTTAPIAASQPPTAPAGDVYRFYVVSLDRIIQAYREANPGVKIAICTLVGRWPLGSPADYAEKPAGRVWWMKVHDLTPVEAAATLERFNDRIRRYARDRGLVLIDAAAAFDSLDRGTLQPDFAHMRGEGYELLAEVMYRGLRDASVVSGGASPRLDELMTKFKRRDA